MLAKFTYLNHKGITSDRRVEVESLDYIAAPGFGYTTGWFLTGIDMDRGTRRSFALVNIVKGGTPQAYSINLREAQK